MKLLTAKKAAEETGLSESIIRAMIKRGECPGIKQGNRFYVNVPMLISKITAMCEQNS